MIRRGAPPGEKHYLAKLTDQQVRQLRQGYDNDMGGYRTLGKRYGISPESARDMVNGRTRRTAGTMADPTTPTQEVL